MWAKLGCGKKPEGREEAGGCLPAEAPPSVSASPLPCSHLLPLLLLLLLLQRLAPGCASAVVCTRETWPRWWTQSHPHRWVKLRCACCALLWLLWELLDLLSGASHVIPHSANLSSCQPTK